MDNVSHDVRRYLQRLPICPVCQVQARKRLFVLDPFGVYECAQCRLRYIDPCLSPEGMRGLYSNTRNLTEINQFHATYYSYGDPDIPSRTVKDFEKTLTILERELPIERRALFDIGAGSGLFLAVAKKRGWQVAGCDSGSENVELAATKFGIGLDRISFEDLDPKDRKYDAISFWDVLEHMIDPNAFLSKVIGMLRPGGRIVVAVPNDRSFLRGMASIIFRLSFGAISGPLKKVYLLEHVAYYTLSGLIRLFGMHGMTLSDSFHTSTDLKKYQFSGLEKIIAATVLALGKTLGLQNRVVAIFKKPHEQSQSC